MTVNIAETKSILFANWSNRTLLVSKNCKSVLDFFFQCWKLNIWKTCLHQFKKLVKANKKNSFNYFFTVIERQRESQLVLANHRATAAAPVRFWLTFEIPAATLRLCLCCERKLSDWMMKRRFICDHRKWTIVVYMAILTLQLVPLRKKTSAVACFLWFVMSDECKRQPKYFGHRLPPTLKCYYVLWIISWLFSLCLSVLREVVCVRVVELQQVGRVVCRQI